MGSKCNIAQPHNFLLCWLHSSTSPKPSKLYLNTLNTNQIKSELIFYSKSSTRPLKTWSVSDLTLNFHFDPSTVHILMKCSTKVQSYIWNWFWRWQGQDDKENNYSLTFMKGVWNIHMQGGSKICPESIMLSDKQK